MLSVVRTWILTGLLLPVVIAIPQAMGHGEVNDYETDVETMYVAYYGRPGDPEGVEFWAEELEHANGDFNAIIDEFGTSAEYTDRFSDMGNAELVDNIYQQLFGRAADDAGRDFYVGKLDAEELSLATIALDIYNGVSGVDSLIVANKLTLAHAFTDHIADSGLDYGDAEALEGIELLSAIDESTDSVETAEERLAILFSLSDDSDCSNYEGSFERIQSIIFDGYDCTNSACHSGENPNGPTGQLDLTAGNAYQSLFRVDASASLIEPTQRVYPGEQALSFLYAKLEAGTNGTALPVGGGSAMPNGGAPISADQLEALRLWIRGGAPEYNDVDEVATLLGCSIGTRPQANKIAAPDAPVRGEGVQFISGPWTVRANSEKEVCFATYYDLNQVPGALPAESIVECEGNQFRNYEGECFASNARTLTQDPQSHHSIIYSYTGAASALDPGWGEWQCLNGPHQGESCDPTQIGVPVEQGGADCGGELYACATMPQRTLNCIGWGPDDFRGNSFAVGGSQTPILAEVQNEGVYNVLPTAGIMVWNSHAFNLSTEDTTVEQYNNVWFASEDQQVYRERAIFDSKDILIAEVPPYEQRTYCSTYTLPQEGARLTDLWSHAHKRGILWQSWLPPQDPSCTVDSGCVPNQEAADYVSRIYNDPLVLKYDPALAYDSAAVADRTIKFCLTYDNGLEYPDLLKLSSQSVGSTCQRQAYCAGGATPGMYCGNDDSLCGDGGVCDACILRGGVTTEDEMFLLLGSYYVVPVD